jgi:NAD(P)-dependent dehydrogenase (short-subunit alcohol dehydrogenase family)
MSLKENPAAENLSGKCAIVTGAGTRQGEGIGNGRAAAVLLAQAGCNVVCADSVKEWAEETARMCREAGGQACVVQADVSKLSDCERIVKAAVDNFRRLDILVNNVGIGGPSGTAEDVDLEQWDKGMRVNVTSMVMMARFAIPQMRKVGGGSIVNLGSVAGLRGGTPHLMCG